jgi:formiminoglutamase
MSDLHSFFAEKHFAALPANDASHPAQIGKKIQVITEFTPDWSDADIVLIGCGEQRGRNFKADWSMAADAVREELYRMYDWHGSVKVADMGNILEGATIGDTRAALRMVLQEIQEQGKVAILIGGSHDLTLQQYDIFKRAEITVNAAVIDMLIDLEETENISDTGFLMDMLTEQPNFIRHFSHLGFQSYYTNPGMLETLDKLRFDCFRLGRIRENTEEMEPVLRNCDLLSIDMKAVRKCDAPFLKDGSPNGLFGDEICQLTRYAGMSSRLSSLGIYGYQPEHDTDRQGAKLIAQMLWYFVDGFLLRKNETDPVANRADFIEYHVALTGNDTLFLKSKKSNRWWMQLPDASFTPCSYNDYLLAAANEIPERWYREQERIV